MDNNSAIRGFLEKLTANGELRNEFQKILETKSFDGAYEFALDHSEEKFSKEEFKECVSELSKVINNEKAKILQESSLDQISGGKNEGTLTDVKEFWTATANEKDYEKMFNSIYENEDKLADDQIKTGYIKKALEASGNINDLIKTIGELWLSHKDRQFEKQEREDTADERKISDLKNQIKIKKLEKMLDEKGIKY